ncbi:hypothetical protein [Streptomyces sp. NPDC050416]|uniref:hypothetical protein n=1 Tax=Streptomyces sp. NPDC050416 TaxID=3365611 RepID=UPI0037BDC89A
MTGSPGSITYPTRRSTQSTAPTCGTSPSTAETSTQWIARLVGRQIVLPIDAAPVDLARPHTSEPRFLEFTVAVDPNTGECITSTCDPAKVSNYFTDRGTPHFLTLVYFRREVLNRYTSQPSRYRIENGRLSCLGLWGISIGTNPDGLIEVYLGDLGRDLPAEECDHWLSFNVPPIGGRDEGRFDRDILGRWTNGPPDPLRRLFAAREHFSTALGALLGQAVRLQAMASRRPGRLWLR